MDQATGGQTAGSHVAAPSTNSTATITRDRVTAVLVVGILVGYNVVDHRVLPGRWWLGPCGVAVLLLVARVAGFSRTELGLSAGRLRSGAIWGLGAIAVVAMVYLVGVLVPATRSGFLDTRYHFGVAGALRSAFVVIPLRTILIEEVAFRSVLWAALARQVSTGWVMFTTSALFGLWHVLPALPAGSANRGVDEAIRGFALPTQLVLVVGTVVFTAAGGLVAAELRRRSGSLLASICLHWATNSLGVLFGLLAWRLAG